METLKIIYYQEEDYFVGWLEDFANLLINTGISGPALYLGIIIPLSVI
ncbi:MAG: hypothetical protein M0R49_10545 [Limnochordia bacterium]|nr:hypothetical protein [Limnochordia bacterium]MDD5605548.1 hypothetical protein [Dehalococcoidales bacterium]